MERTLSPQNIRITTYGLNKNVKAGNNKIGTKYQSQVFLPQKQFDPRDLSTTDNNKYSKRDPQSVVMDRYDGSQELEEDITNLRDQIASIQSDLKSKEKQKNQNDGKIQNIIEIGKKMSSRIEAFDIVKEMVENQCKQFTAKVEAVDSFQEQLIQRIEEQFDAKILEMEKKFENRFKIALQRKLCQIDEQFNELKLEFQADAEIKQKVFGTAQIHENFEIFKPEEMQLLSDDSPYFGKSKSKVVLENKKRKTKSSRRKTLTRNLKSEIILPEQSSGFKDALENHDEKVETENNKKKSEDKSDERNSILSQKAKKIDTDKNKKPEEPYYKQIKKVKGSTKQLEIEISKNDAQQDHQPRFSFNHDLKLEPQLNPISHQFLMKDTKIKSKTVKSKGLEKVNNKIRAFY